MINKEKLLRRIKEYFDNRPEILAVYLFGSLTRGHFNKNSDIDLSLLIDPKLNRIDVFDLKLEVAVELEKIFDIEFDIVIFNTAPIRLKHQIIKGELVLEKDRQFRITEEAKAIRNYLDMKNIYDTYEKMMGKVILDG